MKTVTKIIFTSILSAVAPTFAHAAYLQSHAAYQQNVKPIELTSTVQAARAVRGLDAMAYSSAVSSRSSSQTTGWGMLQLPVSASSRTTRSRMEDNSHNIMSRSTSSVAAHYSVPKRLFPTLKALSHTDAFDVSSWGKAGVPIAVLNVRF